MDLNALEQSLGQRLYSQDTAVLSLVAKDIPFVANSLEAVAQAAERLRDLNLVDRVHVVRGRKAAGGPAISMVMLYGFTPKGRMWARNMARLDEREGEA